MPKPKQRGDSWHVTWIKGGRTGKRQSTTWDEESHALQACQIVEAHRCNITDEQVYAIILGESDSPSTDSTCPTLREWLPKHIAAKTRITPGTRQGYVADAEKHILPVLGDDRLDRITHTKLGKWVNEMREKGYKNTSITRYFSLLFGAYEAAMRERPPLVEENPCRLTDFVRDQTDHDDVGNENAVYLEEDEYKILRIAFDEQLRTMLDFLVDTGLRWSEVSALAVEHIVPPRKGQPAKVRVWRAWKRDRERGRYLGTTKGRRKRELSLTRERYNSLLPLIKGMPKGAFLFRISTGQPFEYGNFYKQVWRPAVVRAMRCPEHPPLDRAEAVERPERRRCREFGGVRDDGKPCGAWVTPGMNRCASHSGPEPEAVSECECPGVLRQCPTPHDLRHTFTSWMLSAGVPPLIVSRWLGHARLETTTEIYGELMPDTDEQVLTAIMNRGQPPKVGGSALAASCRRLVGREADTVRRTKRAWVARSPAGHPAEHGKFCRARGAPTDL